MPIEIVDRPATGELVCLGCTALMSWTKAHSNGRGTDIPAYFSLMPRTDHDEGCTLNFRTFMSGLAKRRGSGIEFRDKTYFLRLPNEALTPNIQKSSNTVSKRSGATSWAQTFTSATAIADFLLNFGEDTEFINQLKIDYKDAKGNPYEMFWHDFCFEATDQAAALKYFEKLGTERIKGQVHPVAIQMTVAGGPSFTGNGVKQKVHVWTGATTTEPNGIGRRLDVWIYSTRLLSTLRDGDVVLALGHGDIWKHNVDNVTEIQLRLEQSWQLARLRKAPRP